VDALTLARALELAHSTKGQRVSIYMPTHRFAPGSQDQDTTRLRNLLRGAAEKLAAQGIRQAEVDDLLGSARSLLDDRPFWLRARDGLAVLVGPEGLSTFRATTPFTESVAVGERYDLRQLLPLIGVESHFWLLAISQKRVRLYEGSAEDLVETPVADMPASLTEALRWDDFEKTSLQFHTGTHGAGGRRPAVFHGTGESDTRDELVRFFRAIDRGLHEHLRSSDAPLLLAGVEYLLPIYRDANTYPNLASDAIPGNPDATTPAALHERATVILEAMRDAAIHDLVSEVTDAWGSPKTTPDPETVIPAAHHGRVATLLITDDAQWWGSYDARAGSLVVRSHPEEGDDDLLGLSALHTIENGGTVVHVKSEDMPHAEVAVAMLRY